MRQPRLIVLYRRLHVPQFATQSSIIQPRMARLPSELWLQILENATIQEAEHLWTSVRRTSRQLRECVDRLFITKYLPWFALSLALPRRDPISGVAKWPEAVLMAQLVMSLESVAPDKRNATFASPLELTDGVKSQNIEDLRVRDILPRARLTEAPVWIYTRRNYTAGCSVELPRNIEWDEQGKHWVWRFEWRRLVSTFYQAKIERREKKKTSQTVRKGQRA